MFKVLLVEDEDMIRRGIRFSIDWVQYDCIVIEEGLNGQDGYEKICELKPDIVITDITMPIMDGISMIREGLKHTFSIIISGYNEFHLSRRSSWRERVSGKAPRGRAWSRHSNRPKLKWI